MGFIMFCTPFWQMSPKANRKGTLYPCGCTNPMDPLKERFFHTMVKRFVFDGDKLLLSFNTIMKSTMLKKQTTKWRTKCNRV